ncbi:MAG TPA: hypothetical protein VHO90_03155 [Bacteroidales bacterium]|nr:hypothetical protein [Bacteroidales bacterium]
MHTLKTAQTAGVIITPTDQESFEQIKKFLNYLTSIGIKVYILGYVDDKKVPQNFLFWKGINLFSRTDLTWAGIPESSSVNDFIEQQFDMLIDLSMDDYFPVQYVASLSRSNFKIGRFGRKNQQCYDLMFEFNTETSLGEYIEQISYYLNLLSNPN